MEILDSKITAVTVFTDRALIVRTAQVALAEGEHTLIFENLPESIDSKSVQASGIGNATLMGVKFKTEFFAENTDETARALEAEITQIQDQINELELERKRWQGEQQFLEGIIQKITSTQEKTENAQLNPESWIKMLDFYSQKQADINQNNIQLAYQIREWEKKRERVYQQIRELKFGGKRGRERRIVEVVVQARQAGELVIELSYIVKHASWIPVYDLRVSTETKRVNLTYNAMVRQNTGEEWVEVKMKISTAKPQMSGKHEELRPWFVDLKQPKFYGGYPQDTKREQAKYDIDRNEITAQNAEIGWMGQEQERGIDMLLKNEDEKNDEKNINIENAIAETGSTAVFFNIAGKHTIKADNTDHRVSILVEDFEGHFRYSAVPKLSPLAYLKARIRNTSAYPLLAGETNIFLDNNFVSNARIENVPPNEAFWAFLGVDESMKVEYKLLRKYEKQEGGLLTKKMTSLMYEYQIKVKNTKNTEEEIVLWEQLPISQNAQIKVHLHEPAYKEDTEQFSKKDHEALRWFYKLKPQEAIMISFRFSVEFPFGQKIDNL